MSKSYVVPWSGKIKVNNLPNDAKVTDLDTKKPFDAEIVFGDYTLLLQRSEGL